MCMIEIKVYYSIVYRLPAATGNESIETPIFIYFVWTIRFKYTHLCIANWTTAEAFESQRKWEFLLNILLFF